MRFESSFRLEFERKPAPKEDILRAELEFGWRFDPHSVSCLARNINFHGH